MAPVKLSFLTTDGTLLICIFSTSEKSQISHSVTSILLPNLRPPNLGTIVLLEPPTTARLHVPFTLAVRLRNNDLRHASELSLSLEPSEGYVVAGLRTGSLPLLLPGTEQTLLFNLIPIMAGLTRLPVFRVSQRVAERTVGGSPRASIDGEAKKSTIGEQFIEVLDMRWHEMDETGGNMRFFVQDGELVSELGDEWMSVLVW